LPSFRRKNPVGNAWYDGDGLEIDLRKIKKTQYNMVWEWGVPVFYILRAPSRGKYIFFLKKL
jgi:hypothetical protein